MSLGFIQLIFGGEGMEKITLTPMETAKLLGISRTTIYSMIRNDEIPHSRIRGKIVFHRPTVENWLVRGASKKRNEIMIPVKQEQ